MDRQNNWIDDIVNIISEYGDDEIRYAWLNYGYERRLALLKKVYPSIHDVLAQKLAGSLDDFLWGADIDNNRLLPMMQTTSVIKKLLEKE